MDIQDLAQLLGNFGEFLGFAAVLATLVYLSMQTRQTRIASERGMTAMVTRPTRDGVLLSIRTAIWHGWWRRLMPENR